MPGAVNPSNPRLDSIPSILLDEGGRFKYILCKIHDAEKASDWKYIVRGTARAEFHSDIYDELDAQLEECGLVCECLGGGKIQHSAENSTLEVFGKSEGYGKANHRMTVDILKQDPKYSGYASITYSDD